MKDYYKNKESSYVQYWDVNNLYDWAMSQKLPGNKFEQIKDSSQLNEDFIKNYNEESDEGYFLEVDVQYLEKVHELHNDFAFLQERIKIEKVEKFVASLHDKTKYVIHIKNLKQLLNRRIVLKQNHKDIKFNQNTWLKSYIDRNTDLKKAKNYFEKYFFKKLMNNAASVKTMENVRKHRYETCHNKKKNKLFGVRTKILDYKVFHRKFVSNRIKRTEINLSIQDFQYQNQVKY